MKLNREAEALKEQKKFRALQQSAPDRDKPGETKQ
jgi:hypothetical protein